METNVECFRRHERMDHAFNPEQTALIELYLGANPRTNDPKTNVMHGIYVALGLDRCHCTPCRKEGRQ